MADRLIKQAIVIRKDLGMRRGKEISQGSHASMAFMVEKRRGNLITLDAIDTLWLQNGQTKITTKVDSEEELMVIYEKAKSLGLKVHLITDLGHTEFNGVPTKTALAIGPNYSDQIDKVTGELKLY